MVGHYGDTRNQYKRMWNDGNESEVWEGMEGGVVWCGVDTESKGRGKEGCAPIMSPRVWESIKAHGWSRIVWTVRKVENMHL